MKKHFLILSLFLFSGLVFTDCKKPKKTTNTPEETEEIDFEEEETENGEEEEEEDYDLLDTLDLQDTLLQDEDIDPEPKEDDDLGS